MASLRFCAECQNLLYPRADNIRRELLYACNRCNYKERIEDNACVYRNDLIQVASESAGVTQDLASDPTLPRSNTQCPFCGYEESVFFQDQSKRTETRMILFHVCSRCNRAFQDPKLKRRNQQNPDQILEGEAEDQGLEGASPIPPGTYVDGAPPGDAEEYEDETMVSGGGGEQLLSPNGHGDGLAAGAGGGDALGYVGMDEVADAAAGYEEDGDREGGSGGVGGVEAYDLERNGIGEFDLSQYEDEGTMIERGVRGEEGFEGYGE